MAVRAAGHAYLFEFKVAEMSPGSALAQLRERRYADKYRDTRNITAFDTADP